MKRQEDKKKEMETEDKKKEMETKISEFANKWRERQREKSYIEELIYTKIIIDIQTDRQTDIY